VLGAAEDLELAHIWNHVGRTTFVPRSSPRPTTIDLLSPIVIDGMVLVYEDDTPTITSLDIIRIVPSRGWCP
jgi:hypothetical protein